MKEILDKSGFEIPGGVKIGLGICVALGILMFIIGLATGDHDGLVRTWETLLINVMFWGGLAQSGVIWAVIWQLTDAKWARPFKRMAEGFGAFLPVCFFLFILVFFGSHVLYEWVEHPFMHHGVAVKQGWLNMHFFVTRNIFWLVLLYGISYLFVITSLKPDFGLARQLSDGWGGKFGDFLLKGYGRQENEVVRLELISRKLAPILALAYAIGASFLAWDFIMTLDQEWFSTLFGVFVIIGSLQSALGILLAVSVTCRSKFQLEEYITINRLHDLAKMMFAFSLLWTYMGFSQYIVIWYGNIPEETPFLIIRSFEQPWQTLLLVLIFWLFISVFLLLLPKTTCRTPWFIRIMGIYVAAGQWLAMYFLIVPSLQHEGHYHFYFGFHEILITLGFAGAFFLCYLKFLSNVPLLPISDKHLCKTWHGH
ncbi:MAG: molybdopterin oxidoreductase [SAR324 cluster bacterium]|nr:molybdopterin oxidoreductase [SAR324 cluster bacterium]